MQEATVLFFQLLTAGLLIGQIGVNIGLFRRLLTYKPTESQWQSDFNGGTSVVIAARNESENLEANLPYILEQEHERFEVIVVNDHSSDETIAVVRKLQDHYPHLHLVNLGAHIRDKPGKKLSLLLGIKKAQYEVVLLTDADCCPAGKQWIQCMEAPFSQSVIQFSIGFSPYKKGRNFLTSLVRYDTFQTAFYYMGLGLAGIPYMGVGRNLAYRRQYFMDQEGFGPHHSITAGDDDLLVNRLVTVSNAAFVLNPESFTWTIAPNSWRRWIHQKRRHLSVSKYYKANHKLTLGSLWLFQFTFYAMLIICVALAPYSAVNLGLLISKVIAFYSFSIPVLKRFQMSSLTLRAFGLDILYQLMYTPIMGFFARFQKTQNEWL